MSARSFSNSKDGLPESVRLSSASAASNFSCSKYRCTSRARGGIRGLHGQVLFIRIGGFRFLLLVEAARQAQQCPRFLRLALDGVAKLLFRIRGAIQGEIRLAQMQQRVHVQRIKDRGIFEGRGSGACFVFTVPGTTEKKVRAAL